MAKLYYIGERINPQLSKAYFNAYGQLTKKDASKKEECAYGSLSMISFNTKEEYEQKIEELKSQDFSINNSTC
jgi:hypothetical protein